MRAAPVAVALALIVPGLALGVAVAPHPGVAQATVDVTAYPDALDSALAYVLAHRQPSGCIHEAWYPQPFTDCGRALVLLARSGRFDARGDVLGGVVQGLERSQNPDGSWGTRGFYTIGLSTSLVMRGLLDAGYDADAPAVERAVAYAWKEQTVTGYWTDGIYPSAPQTARFVDVLLGAGEPADHPRIQQAVQWILARERDGSGAFGTPYATAEVIIGLDAYARAQKSGRELVTTADAEAAIDRALAFIAREQQPDDRWHYNWRATAGMVQVLGRYHTTHGLPLPAWLHDAAAAVVATQLEDGGFLTDSGLRESGFTHTLFGAGALVEVPRPLAASADALPFHASFNRAGTYRADAVLVELVDADGRVRAVAGDGTLAWSDLEPGAYAVRATVRGAPPAYAATLRLS